MSEYIDITEAINKKKEETSKKDAATIAARLVLMLLSPEYNSKSATAIRHALENGIEAIGATAGVNRLYDRLGMFDEDFKASVQDLASNNPEACIALCDVFCEAIEVGAAKEDAESGVNGDEYAQLRRIVSVYQNRDVAEAFAKMHAPKAAALFSQPTVT